MMSGLNLWMIALNAIPFLKLDVKFFTSTPLYLLKFSKLETTMHIVSVKVAWPNALNHAPPPLTNQRGGFVVEKGTKHNMHLQVEHREPGPEEKISRNDSLAKFLLTEISDLVYLS